MQGIADRLRILKKAGIDYEKIGWGGASKLPCLVIEA